MPVISAVASGRNSRSSSGSNDSPSTRSSSAPSDSDLQDILTIMGNILGQQGIVLGDIDYYDIGDPTYNEVTNAEFGQMLQLSSSATEHRLNLFFVQEAIGGGILGVAAALSGPSRNGTPNSGVRSKPRRPDG